MANQKIIARKQEVVEEIKSKANEATTFVIFENHGLTVAETNELRRKLRENDSEFKIYKNTLLTRALNDLKIDLGETLEGPKAIAFGKDAIAPIKVLSEFAKNHEALELKVGMVDGEVADIDQLKKLATIPSREGLLTMLAGGLMGVVRDSEEVRSCIEAPVIDTLKGGNDNVETFRKVCLFLEEEKEQAGCRKVNCISLGSPHRDAALKMAMSYANEQKRTLFVNLAGEGEDGKPEHSVSRYVFEEGAQIAPLALNHYLDVVGRTAETEKGFDLLRNERFSRFLEEKSGEYERIVIGTGDAAESVDACVAARLCDQSFLVCGRKNVGNEALYRLKNEADVNRIKISGILLYE